MGRGFCFLRAMTRDAQRVRSCLRLILVCLFVWMHPLWSAVSVHPQHSHTLKVGFDNNYPPYEYLDAKGDPAGFNIDLIRAIAEESGLSIELKSGAWNDIRSAFERGELDLLAGMFATDERRQHYLFSVPHSLVAYSVFIRRSGPLIRGEVDFPGKRILVEKGDLSWEILKNRGYTVEGLPSPEDALKALAAGRGDCAVIARAPGLFHIRQNGWKDLVRSGPPMMAQKYCFAVDRDSLELLSILNEALFVLKSSGRLEEIAAKHFHLLERADLPFADVIKRAKYILLPIVGLLLAVSAWTWGLRRLVARQTRTLRYELEERLRMEEKLRTEQVALELSQAALGAIFRMAQSALVLSRWPDDFILDVNEAWEELTGYAREEVVHASPLSLGLFMDENLRCAGLQQLEAEGRVHNLETRLRRKNGEERIILWSSRLFTIGNTVRRVSSAVDITDIRQAEQENRHLKDYLNSIIDSMPAILVGLSEDGAVTQWNRCAQAELGLAAEVALGKDFRTVMPLFAGRIEPLLREVAHTGQPVNLERVAIGWEKKGRYCDIMLYPLLIDRSNVGTVVRIEDVTERTRMQELMVQTEKMMSLGGLAAGMAHEVNNPLGIVSQSSQNISRRLSVDLPANRLAAQEAGISLEAMRVYFEKRQIPQFIDSIQEAVGRCARIVSHMLEFSRRSESTKVPSSLTSLLDQSLELAGNDYDLKKKYDFRAIEIQRHYPAEDVMVSVVPMEIEQVFLNLLRNAAQAMAESAKPPRLVLRVLMESRYAVVEIEDNGPGMDEYRRSRILEPFFTTKEPGVGTGLGLSVSYTIITRNHKGLLEVRSTPGQGACFTVRIPLQGQETYV